MDDRNKKDLASMINHLKMNFNEMIESLDNMDNDAISIEDYQDYHESLSAILGAAQAINSIYLSEIYLEQMNRSIDSMTPSESYQTNPGPNSILNSKVNGSYDRFSKAI